MEELYSKFTTDFLPKIQEGMVITKDYFTDLFGRYIHYLIVMDSLNLILSLLTILITLIVAYRIREWAIETTDGAIYLFLLLLVFPFALAMDSADNLVKDIYIPEIRIYEELSSFIKE